MAHPEGVSRMLEQCSLSPRTCAAALSRNGGDVAAAMRALVDSGALTPQKLKFDAAPAELIGRADTLERIRGYWSNRTIRKVDREKLRNMLTKRMESRSGMQKLGRQLKAQWQAKQEGQRQRREVRQRRAAKGWRKPSVLRLRPFPPLKYNDVEHVWEGGDVLTRWPRSPLNPARKVNVRVPAPTGWPVETVVPPAREQVAAYRYLKDHQAEMAAAILAAAFEEYARFRERFLADRARGKNVGRYEPPPARGPQDMKPLLGPVKLTVVDYAKGGVAYVGWGMRCDWDPEGLGVMTHKSRVRAIGELDVVPEYPFEKEGGRPLRV